MLFRSNPLGGPPARTAPGIPSEALPLPSGNRSEHGSRAAGRSELRIRELEAEAKRRAMASAQRQLAHARLIAQLELEAYIAEQAAFDARIALEHARAAANQAHSSRAHAGDFGETADHEQPQPKADGTIGILLAPSTALLLHI